MGKLHGKTGFILEKNLPEHMAKGIIRALRPSKLGAITKSAHELIEKNYTYTSALNRYEAIVQGNFK